MDVREYLHNKGFAWRETKRPTGLQAIMKCPFCGDNDFAVNLDSGAFCCIHKNKCGRSGSFWQLQKELGDTPHRLQNDRTFLPQPKKEYKPVETHAKKLSDKAMAFLRDRGFTDELIKYFKLGENSDGTAIMYPFYKDGKVVNIKYRMIAKKDFYHEKGGEPSLFNRDNCNDDTLYITEGQDDCIALKAYGFDGVSVPSGTGDMSWIEHEWDFLNRFQKIYLMFDTDVAGIEAVKKIVKRLGEYRCYTVTLPCKDVNDCLKNGIAKEEIFDCILRAHEYEHEHIKRSGDFINDIIAYTKDTKKFHGVKTGFSNIDAILKGWRQGELTVWTGTNGSGKSTLLNQIVINLVTTGEKCLTASLEMYPRNYLYWAAMQSAGKEFPDENDIRYEIGKFSNTWYIYNVNGMVRDKDLIDAFIFASRKYDIKHFFVDSLMRINLQGKDNLEAQKDFASSLVDFANEYEAHVHLVAHPRKGQTDRETPDKVDIAGTGHITNLAHNVLVVYRLDQKTKAEESKRGNYTDNRVYIKKNRQFGKEGEADFMFDEKTKRFLEDKKSY